MYRKKKTTLVSTSIITTTTTTHIVTNEINDDKLLHNLNSEQKRAVTCPINQSTLVLSGAGLLFSLISFIFFLLIIKGSGKTRVLTSRIAYLLKNCNVKPYEIFAVTFTNKAALEMRHRISQILPGIQLTDMWLGTFHGLGLFLLLISRNKYIISAFFLSLPPS